MKYYVYSTEIDTWSGSSHSSYQKAIKTVKERESLRERFDKYDDVGAYPAGTYEADNDEEAIICFHDGYCTEHVKGCGKAHAFFEYTLYRGEDVDRMWDEDDDFCSAPMLAYSVSDMFDEDDEEELN